MNKKTICAANLNSIVANTKADKCIAAIRIERPDFLTNAEIPTQVQLRKVTLREQAFGIPAGQPLYAFAKQVSKRLIVLVEVRTGKAELFAVSRVASMTPVTDKFTIDGVVYGKKDTMNDCPRYAACGSTRKPRAKALFKKRLMDTAREYLHFRI